MCVVMMIEAQSEKGFGNIWEHQTQQQHSSAKRVRIFIRNRISSGKGNSIQKKRMNCTKHTTKISASLRVKTLFSTPKTFSLFTVLTPFHHPREGVAKFVLDFPRFFSVRYFFHSCLVLFPIVQHPSRHESDKWKKCLSQQRQ